MTEAHYGCSGPGEVCVHLEVASACNVLAGVHRQRGELDASRPLFERALAIARRALPANHPTVAAATNKERDNQVLAGRALAAL